MKKLAFVIGMVIVLIAPVFADLLEDADKLTPEQAVQFEKKLDQKRSQAIPKNTRISGFIEYIKPTSLNNAFPTVSPMTNVYGVTFDLRYPLTNQLLIGGSFGGAGNYVQTESSSKIYEDMFLAYGQAQLVLELRMVQVNNFILSLTPGAGVILGGYNYSKTDDNAKTSYNTNRWGSGLCTSLALDATWKVHEDWGFGLGISTFSGKVGGMRKILSNVDTTAPEIDFSGTTFRLSGSKTF